MQKFRTVLELVSRYRLAFILGPIFVLLTNAFRVVNPEIVEFVFDYLAGNEKTTWIGRFLIGTTDRLGLDAFGRAVLTVAATSIFGFAVIQGVFQFLMRYTVIGASRRVEFDLRQKLFDHLQTLPPSTFERMRIGDVMTRATSDLESVRMVTGPAVMYMVNTLTVLPLCLAMMFLKSKALAFLAMIPLALLALSIRLIMPRMYRDSKDVQERMSRISNHVQENFAGVRVVQAFHREEHELERFDGLNEAYLDSSLRLAWSRGWVNGVINAFSGLGILLVLWVGGGYVLRDQMTLGQFVAFNQYQIMLTWPMIAMGWVLSLLQRGAASMERIDAILSIEPSIRDEEPDPSREAIDGTIEFRGLSFAYEDGPPVLRDLNLSIPAGSTIAIVGRTGSGKSTLAALIPRLLEVPRHRLFVDGEDIHRLPLGVLRRSIAVVPQDTFLFSDTIAANIAFAAPEATEEAILEAARAAGLEETIEALPDGYSQMIGERGVSLSGGQKQRMAIARALLANPRILILDDCLSAVDTETEERILKRIQPKLRERTCVVISHRVSTIRNADRIYVLDEGSVIEEGTHEELVAAGGSYAEMDRRQRLERELEDL